MPKNEPDQGGSIARAKRLFLTNLCLFGCLVLAWLAISAGDDATEAVEAETPIHEESALSNLELAYLKGEMQALREHPGTMPKYEERWVLRISQQEIERDPTFAGANEIELEQLTQAYFNAYTQRFNEYFEDRDAHNRGYTIGVKWNPGTRDHLAPPSIMSLFNSRKTVIIEKYEIPDEATWRLFCESFQNGFNESYWIIEDGVTAKSRFENIKIEF